MKFYLEGPGGLPGAKQAREIRTALNVYFEGNLTVTGTLAAGAESVTSELLTVASANAFTVGANGVTNPVFNVDTNTASVATGLNVKGAAAAGGVALLVLSSGTNEALTVDAKGSGAIGINTLSTTSGLVTIGNTTSLAGATINGTPNIVVAASGTIFNSTIGGSAALVISKAGSTLTIQDTNDNITISSGASLALNGTTKVTVQSAVATPAAGSAAASLLFGTTAGFGIYYGSGAPTVSAAQGSIYIRSDGSSTSTRLYVNTNGTTGWTNFTSAT